MGKMIRFTGSYLDECRRDFEKALTDARLSNGKFNFTKELPSDDQKATVYITTEAWTKMVMLLNDFDKEVAWHGVAHRGEQEDENAYYITDIVVYPQEVSGTTVEMDTEKYATWLMENAEDDRFNNIRMQGHSHVKMGVTPSSVDLSHQEEIVNMLGDEDFYIFMIWNKFLASNCKIYDLKKNALFEDREVTVVLADQDESLREFLAGAKEMVKEKYTFKGYTTPTYMGGVTQNQDDAWGDDKPPFGGVSPKPYNPVSKPREKPRTRIEEDEAEQLGLPKYG